MKKHSVVIFIALALGITWLLWIPALLSSTKSGYALPTIDYLLQQRGFQFVDTQHFAVVLMFSLAVYGPLLAALIAVGIENGRKGISEWFSPMLRLRLPARWYLLALITALVLVLLPMLVGALLGLVAPRPQLVLPSILLILGLLIHQFFTSGLGEEPGWRGYLLPRLQKILGNEKGIWVAGLVWGVWHYPFTIYYTLQGAPDMALTAQLSILIPSLIGQTISLIGMTYIYAWFMNETKSLFLAAVFHALGNTFNAVAAALVVANPIISLAIAAMPWLVVLVLEKTGKLSTR